MADKDPREQNPDEPETEGEKGGETADEYENWEMGEED